MPELDTSVAPLALDDLLRLQPRPGGAEGRCHAGSPTRVFGGHLVAQALRAATPDDQHDRSVHSMHAYFVAAARPDEPVHYDVTETRNSRSFTVRQVVAHQSGAPVLTLTASAHVEEPAERHEPPVGPLPPVPVDVSEAGLVDHGVARTLRMVPVRGAPEGNHQVWVRPRAPFPTDPSLGPAALAYMADAVLPVASILRTGANPMTAFGSASLDFAMWFHRPAVDGWLLFDCTCSTFGGSRGLSHLQIRTPAGELIASAAQEVLVRTG